MKQDIQTIRNLLALLTTIVIVYLIAVLSPLLIPLALALFIAILLQPILAWFERKNMSFWFSISAISVVTVTFMFLVGRLIFVTGKSIVKDKDTLLIQIEGKLQHILEWVNDKTELDLKISELIENTTNFLSTSLVLKYFGSVANSAGDFFRTFFLLLPFIWWSSLAEFCVTKTTFITSKIIKINSKTKKQVPFWKASNKSKTRLWIT